MSRFFPDPLRVSTSDLTALVVVSLTATATEALAVTEVLSRLVDALSALDGSPTGPTPLTLGLDWLTPGPFEPSNSLAIVLASCLLALTALLHVALGRLVAKISEGSMGSLRRQLGKAVFSSDLPQLRAEKTGAIETVMTSVAQRIAMGTVGIVNGIAHAVMITGFLLVCIVLSPGVTAGLAVVFLLVLVVIVPILRLIRRLALATEESEAAMSAEFITLTSAFAELKTFGLESKASTQFKHFIDRSTSVRKSLGRWNAVAILIYRDIALVAFAIYFAAVVGITSAETATIPTVAVLGLRSLASVHSVNSARNKRAIVDANCAQVRSLLARLRAENVPVTRGTPAQVALSFATVCASRAEFEYTQGKPLFHPLSFELPAHGLVVVVGPSGVGKSTLLELLAGLRAPSAGSVHVCGINPNTMSEAERSRTFSACFQETRVLASSLGDNVRFLRDDVSDRQVRDALESVGLWEEIAGSPSGLSTQLGQGDNLLSGGQRQRLGIARALVVPSPVVLLDEPTSALDRVSEGKVLWLLRETAKDRLIVAVSHRQELIDGCDQVIEVRPAG